MSKERLLLAFIIVFGVIVRLYHFSSPIADWHSWRQADTSSVSRNFTLQGFDFLHPRFDDLSNVASGKDNPLGYRFVEFPIYNFLQAGLTELFHFSSLEEWGRIVTIFASSLSTLFLFLIIARHADKRAALLAAFFFSFLPYSIYFGRVILPDPLMVTTTLGAIYFFDLWIGYSKVKEGGAVEKMFFALLSIMLTASTLLLKPFAAFFLLPMLLLTFNQYGLAFLKQWRLYIFALLSCLPLVLWRLWMLQYPEGIPVNEWLFNGGNIRFKGAFFYWVFGDHIGRELLGYVGYGLVLLGIFVVISKMYVKQKKEVFFFLSFLISTVAYLFFVARGNVQHDYYQIPILPTLSLFMGFGGAFLFNPPEGFSKIGGRFVLFFFSIFTLFLGWYVVRDFFNVNNPNIVVAGEMVDKLTPKDAKVIALYDGDTTFLYQTKRSGWASFEKSLPEMIQLGAQYLVIANPTQNDFDGFGKQYPIIAKDSSYLIIKLQ